jgi:hypothetical protein
MSFTFNQGAGVASAFGFIDVKPVNGKIYKVIAYLPRYNPKDLSVSGGFPYRERFSGPENLQTFRGDMKGTI